MINLFINSNFIFYNKIKSLMFLSYLFIYFTNLLNSLIIFNSVYVYEIGEIRNKTILFYLSYIFNFKILNKQYNKIRIETINGIYKIYTDKNFKTVYEESKNLKPLMNIKKFISFKINNIEYKEEIKKYINFNNSINDFYLFNKPKDYKPDIKKISYQYTIFNNIFNNENEENTNKKLNEL